MNQTTAKFLKQNPLFNWVIWLILGVVAVLQFPISSQLILVAIFVIGAIVSRIWKNQLFDFILSSGMFLILGMLLAFLQLPKTNLVQDSNVLIANVKEVKLGKGLWDQSIVEVDSKSNSSQLLLYLERGNIGFQVGDIVAIRTEIEPIRNRNNPGEFDAEFYWKSKGIYNIGFVKSDQYVLLNTDNQSMFSHWFRNIHDYSSEVLTTYLPQDYSGLMKAMLLGNRSELDPEMQESFVHAGVMHVLAVSGLHVGLIAYFLSFLFQQFLFRKNPNYGVVLTIVLLWFYAGITGFSPSVLRSVFMFTFLIGSQLFGRNYSSINILSFTALILLAINPFLILDLGFQLSFLAMLGIFSIYPLLVTFFQTKFKPLDWIWKGTIIGVSAQLMTLPIALYYFHQFSNYFFISNLIVMVFATILLGGGLLLLVTGKITFIGTGISVVLGWVIFVFVEGIFFIDQLPGSVGYGFTPSIWWVVSIYIFIALILYVLYEKRHVTAFFIVTILACISIQYSRSLNMNKRELVVFNATDTIILLNQSGIQYCFYKAPNANVDKVKRMVNDYKKMFPGNLKMIPLYNRVQEIKGNSLELRIEDNDSSVDFILNGKRYSILRDLKRFKKEEHIEYIASSRLSSSSLWSHELENGALRIPL